MSRPAIMVAADPPRGAAEMASLLPSLLVEANDVEDDNAVETPGALVVDTNAAPEP